MPESEPKPIRKQLHRREGGIRFVTFSCQRRLPLLSKAGSRNVFVESLYAARAKFGFPLYAWVVMPEHVHLMMMATEEAPLPRILQFIKQSAAQQILGRWKEMNAPILGKLISYTGRPRFWQAGGGFDRNVRTLEELLHEIRYIHRNPVERELCFLTESWEWSSVHWWMKKSGALPCEYPPFHEQAFANWKGFK
ncbi:MAG: transposase [Phycisphaerales bacterium]|nr:transposase [Planctomycetota bacterium]